MNDKKNGLDEMQNQHRNKVGNHMFLIMTSLLFINNGLRGIGITWIEYPANIMVIVIVCLSIYLVRLFIANAYTPISRQSNNISWIIVVICAIAVGASAFLFFGQSSVEVAETTDGYGAIALLIASAVGLIVVFATALVKKRSNKDDED